MCQGVNAHMYFYTENNINKQKNNYYIYILYI